MKIKVIKNMSDKPEIPNKPIESDVGSYETPHIDVVARSDAIGHNSSDELMNELKNEIAKIVREQIMSVLNTPQDIGGPQFIEESEPDVMARSDAIGHNLNESESPEPITDEPISFHKSEINNSDLEKGTELVGIPRPIVATESFHNSEIDISELEKDDEVEEIADKLQLVINELIGFLKSKRVDIPDPLNIIPDDIEEKIEDVLDDVKDAIVDVAEKLDMVDPEKKKELNLFKRMNKQLTKYFLVYPQRLPILNQVSQARMKRMCIVNAQPIAVKDECQTDQIEMLNITMKNLVSILEKQNQDILGDVVFQSDIAE